MRTLLTAVVDLALPRACVGCDTADGPLCARCRGAAWAPRTADVGGLPVTSAATYAGALRSVILAYKERGRRDLAGPLAVVLAAVLAAMLDAGLPGPPAAALVPVPSTRRATRERGGDHVRRLALRAARGSPHRTVAALRWARPVADSVGLTAAARRRNVDGAMAARPPATVRPAVLVDDIVTTGATLTEAARALRAAGWTVLGAVVLARAERPG